MERTNTAEGYDYLTSETGELVAVSQRTKKVYPALTLTVPVGTTVATPDLKDMKREAMERQEAFNKQKRTDKNETGPFYSIPSTEDFSGISPANAARMVYLCTYMDYEGKLMMSKRTPMRRKDLEGILGLSHAQTWRFFCEVKERGYLTEDDAGNLIPDKNKFKRGKFKRSVIWFQVYIKGVRSLYNATDAGQHKQIGALFSLLPFINTEYNMLCSNPDEKEFDRVNIMNLRQFCEAIGYDPKNLKRKIEELRGITFDVNGRRELFYSVVGDGLNLERSRLYVNPNVLYSGTQYDTVRILGAFCEESG